MNAIKKSFLVLMLDAGKSCLVHEDLDDHDDECGYAIISCNNDNIAWV